MDENVNECAIDSYHPQLAAGVNGLGGGRNDGAGKGQGISLERTYWPRWRFSSTSSGMRSEL